ncbi:MAG: hypothetical protein ABR497_02585 [Kiritimatiellia bacterium]|nr:hypothetical protein [Lentisphaerota bacterium]
MSNDAERGFEINCPACGRETLLKRDPVYEGFRRVGERLSCLGCGHVFADEAEAPFIQRVAPRVFDGKDVPRAPQVFAANEAGRTCRHCAHYVVNPFVQRCALKGGEVEATDSCRRFKVRPEKKQPDPF